MDLNKKVLRCLKKATLRTVKPKYDERIGLLCRGVKRLKFSHNSKHYDISVFVDISVDLNNPQYNECDETYVDNLSPLSDNYDELKEIIPEWDYYDLDFHMELNDMAEKISFQARKDIFGLSFLNDPRIFKTIEELVSQLLS